MRPLLKMSGILRSATSLTITRPLLLCALAAAISLAGLAALHPLFASIQLKPLDTLSAGLGNTSLAEDTGPLPPRDLYLRLAEGARFCEYTFTFKARISGAVKPCRLLAINPDTAGLTLAALPGGTLALSDRLPGTAEERELARLPAAFADGQWFTGSILKTWGNIVLLQLSGQRQSAAVLADFMPPGITRFSIGDKDSPACSVSGLELQFKSIGYRALPGKLPNWQFYQLLQDILWFVFLLAALGLVAQCCWLACAPPDAPRADEGVRRGEFVALLLLTGIAIATAFHYIEGGYLGRPSPLNSFLCNPKSSMTDLLNTLSLSTDLNPYLTKVGAEPALYFPFTYLPLYLLAQLSRQLVTILFTVLALALFACINREYLKRAGFTGTALGKNLLIFSCFSYPLLFCLDRGNLEIYVFLAMAAAVFLLERGKSLAGAAFLALAIAVKGYPAVFLLLFLKRKDWRAALLACGLAGALVLAPLLLYKGGFAANLTGLRHNMDFFFHRYALDNYDYTHNSSLFNLERIGSYILYGWQDRSFMLRMFNLAALLLGGGAAYYIWRKENLLWKQVALLVCATVLLTPASNDYKLIALFLPLWLFINESARSRFDGAYAVILALLLVPKEYPINLSSPMNEVALSTLLNPLLMLLLCALIITEGLAQPAAQEK